MKRYWLVLPGLLLAAGAAAELAVERIPHVRQLPADYPDTWVFAHDANFMSLIAGRVIVVDVAAATEEYKGAIGAAQFATFIESSARSELYVGETFYSRGTIGERTDVVTVYDKATLAKTAEIVLPNNNRGLFVTNKYAMRLVDGDRYLLLFNFTPASSVSVVDVFERRLLGEIAVPGCAMVYPTGERGFTSICGDGSTLSLQFDAEGRESSRVTGERFFSVDDDPVFDKPVYVGATAYFVSYLGRIYTLDMGGERPAVTASWPIVTEREAADGWRPGGWQVVTADGEGLLYVIMQSDGFDGSHKSGGEQVWVVDADSGEVVRRLTLETPAFSIELVGGDAPLLVVTNVAMGVDVYTPGGRLQRTISLGDAAMPVILHSKR